MGFGTKVWGCWSRFICIAKCMCVWGNSGKPQQCRHLDACGMVWFAAVACHLYLHEPLLTAANLLITFKLHAERSVRRNGLSRCGTGLQVHHKPFQNKFPLTGRCSLDFTSHLETELHSWWLAALAAHRVSYVACVMGTAFQHRARQSERPCSHWDKWRGRAKITK